MHLLHIFVALAAVAYGQESSSTETSSPSAETAIAIAVTQDQTPATATITATPTVVAATSTQSVVDLTTSTASPGGPTGQPSSPQTSAGTTAVTATETSAENEGLALTEKRVQTTEAASEVVSASGEAQASAPAVQAVPSPRNPKYVDIESIKHPPPEEAPPELPSKPFPKNITIRLENLACEYPQYQRPGLRIDVEKTFKQLSENISEVQLTDASCKMFLTLNVTVTAIDGDFKKLLAKLEEHVKNITVGEHMIITGFTLHDSGEHQVDLRAMVTRAGRFPTYREELIILIAVIILLIIVLFIACIICSIKCCRRSPSTKTLDILETQTPHARSMGFSNQIPRAHTLYSPTASEYSGCLSPMTPFGPGVVQSFDTCLVPLEDVTLSAGSHTFSAARAPVQRPNNLPIRQKVDFSPKEKSRFRSYNYSIKHNRTLPRTSHAAKSYGTNASQSTEQLTKHHSLDDDSGVDNPTYLPTPSTPHVSSDIAETYKM